MKKKNNQPKDDSCLLEDEAFLAEKIRTRTCLPAGNVLSYLIVGFLFVLLTSPLVEALAKAGNTKIDSLKKVIETADHDTTKVKALNELVRKFIFTKPDTALELAKQALELSNTLEYINGQIVSYHNIGYVNYVQSDYEQALSNWQKTLELREQQGDKQGMAYSYGNIGVIYEIQSDYSLALEYYFKDLKIEEELGNKQGMATSYNNIGIIYKNQSDYPKALDYYFKSLQIEEELGNKRGMGGSYNNIGGVYYEQSDYPLALDYYFKSIEIKRELKDTLNAHYANTYNNIGNIYKAQSNQSTDDSVRLAGYSLTLNYYFKSLKIFEKLDNKRGMAASYTNMGSLYTALYKKDLTGFHLSRTGGRKTLSYLEKDALLDTALYYYRCALIIEQELSDEWIMSQTLAGIGNIYTQKKEYAEALKHYQQAAMLADSTGALHQESEAHSGQAECYENLGNYKLALDHYKRYSTLKDSVFNEEKSKEMGKLEAGFEYDKKLALEQAEHEKQSAVAASESKRQKVIIYAVSGGLGLLLILTFLIYRGYRQKKKANMKLERKNVTITRQKKEIEEKNKDIIDSIRYAENIQKAILPPVEDIKKALPDSFVLFKPKDIVSGDFYFFSQVNQYTIIAAVDCTGHGVPGAFMSMMGNSLLNEIVNDRSVTDVAEVLNQLRSGVIHAFGKAGSTGEQKDGMDIALCAFMRDKDNGIVNLQFAGAYNPLYLIREGRLQQVKADKQPVGYHFEEQKPFTNHEIQLKKGDTIYIFSDGYQDQFGGERGKKFMSKRFRQLFLDIQEISMEEQKEHLDKTIEDWKGDGEQVDDILVIGVRI